MPKQSWLADNEHRAFPLIDPANAALTGPSGPTTLPFSALVDFACVLGPAAGTASVFFQSLSRAAGVLSFAFSGTGALADSSLIFTRPIVAPEFATSRASDTTDDAGPGTCASLLWEGSLTTGELAETAALLADGQTLTAAAMALPVEPICVRYTVGTLNSVNLANRIRTVVTAPAGCEAVAAGPYEAGSIVANTTCLSGALTLVAGHNCGIAQASGSNTLTIAASLGAGTGPVCGEIPTYPGEAPPEGSTLLTGGPACNQVISSINGQSAALLSLNAGTGVVVSPSQTTANTLVAAVTGGGLSTCT